MLSVRTVKSYHTQPKKLEDIYAAVDAFYPTFELGRTEFLYLTMLKETMYMIYLTPMVIEDITHCLKKNPYNFSIKYIYSPKAVQSVFDLPSSLILMIHHKFCTVIYSLSALCGKIFL